MKRYETGDISKEEKYVLKKKIIYLESFSLKKGIMFKWI